VPSIALELTTTTTTHSLRPLHSQNGVLAVESRYYRDDDLVHPSAFAKSYIFSKFEHCFFSSQTIDVCAKLKQIKSNVDHRVSPSLVASSEYQAHLANTLRLIQALETQVAAINMSQEKEEILARLI
jgi:hypothetical protein